MEFDISNEYLICKTKSNKLTPKRTLKNQESEYTINDGVYFSACSLFNLDQTLICCGFFPFFSPLSLDLSISSFQPEARALPIQAHYEAIRRISISIGSPQKNHKPLY